MDKKAEEMDERMKARQQRPDEREAGEGKTDFAPGGNTETLKADGDQTNPAAMAGAAGGTGGLSTDLESGGDSGASTGTDYHGHVGGGGGTATQGNS